MRYCEKWLVVVAKAINHSCMEMIGVDEKFCERLDDRLDKIIESDGFDKGGAMVIDFGFTALGYLFAKRMGNVLSTQSVQQLVRRAQRSMHSACCAPHWNSLLKSLP